MEFIGVGSFFIVALTGTFSGMVLALQMVHSLKQFQAEQMVGGIVALSLTREISPVFAGIMVTARAGSSWAAELGNMRVTEQIDAITTDGHQPGAVLARAAPSRRDVDAPACSVSFTRASAWLARGWSRSSGCTSIPAFSSTKSGCMRFPERFLHGRDQGHACSAF